MSDSLQESRFINWETGSNTRGGSVGDPATEDPSTEPASTIAVTGDAAPNTPAEFAAFVKAELAKYEGIVKATGAKVG